MWTDPYMAQLVAIQHRNDAMERERKNRLIRETANPAPSQNTQEPRRSLLKQILNIGCGNQRIKIGRQAR